VHFKKTISNFVCACDDDGNFRFGKLKILWSVSYAIQAAVVIFSQKLQGKHERN
jgi:hypothetical protein